MKYKVEKILYRFSRVARKTYFNVFVITNVVTIYLVEIVIHKQTKLSEFKEMLESKMSCSAEMFKVCSLFMFLCKYLKTFLLIL
jgi:hypothetical protein